MNAIISPHSPEGLRTLRHLGDTRGLLPNDFAAANDVAEAPAAKSIVLSPSMGFDTSETLTSAMVATLAGLHFIFGVRYVPLAGGGGGIQPIERDAFYANKVALMLVQFARTNGTAAQGTSDGAAAAQYALKLLGAPIACLWLDLYNVISASAAIAYANAWYNGAVAAGYYGSLLGVYFEPGVPLTSEQRYQNLAFPRYWQPGAIAPEVASRGSQMRQAYPGNVFVSPGIVIDYDFASSDFHGSQAMAAVAA